MNLVAIVGRPNVGKSTLFNRLVGRRDAIVESEPGVTRDRIYGYSDWNGKQFTVVDTGGFIPGSEDKMERAIREQAMIAIEEAQSILFVCDGKDGVTTFDQDIATILRQSSKPVTLVINKCDNPMEEHYAHEFYSLGLGDPFPISASNGRNTGDFLDDLVDSFIEEEESEEDTRLKIAVVGRPNAGKSSLTNSLIGKARTIVTDIPGTTRDAIDTTVKYHGEEIVLIDTAGLRRRSHIKHNVELYSVIRTAKAIERCDVAVVMIDAERGLEDQDKKIINQVDKARKGMIFAVNKWDLVDKDSDTAKNYTKFIYDSIRSYDYIPVVFISALTGQRNTKLLQMAKEIQEKRTRRIKTSKLNDTLLPEFSKTPPPSVRGLDLRINYITQVGIEPPVFAFFLNQPKLLPDSYKRFMERKLREAFDFDGTPISFVFRRKNVPWEELNT
jgi:GTP-binding protein